MESGAQTNKKGYGAKGFHVLRENCAQDVVATNTRGLFLMGLDNRIGGCVTIEKKKG